MQAEVDSFTPRNRFLSTRGGGAEADARDLLHARLRSCLVFLTAVFGVYLIWGLSFSSRRSANLGVEAAAVGMIALAAASLFAARRPSLLRLRTLETLVFGGIAVYATVDLYVAMRASVLDSSLDVRRVANFFKSDLAHTTALIFIYAIFIPNDWRRALSLISGMALAPFLAVALLFLDSPEFRTLVDEDPAMGLKNLGEHMALLALAVFAAAFGVKTIQEHRREAVRHREMMQYRLSRKLGAGGMGEVFLAEHQMLKRPCAVKLIARQHAASESSRARFEMEVRATARLSHWNTVDVYDYGRTEDGEFFYVMEYLPGLSLQDLVDRYGPLPASRTIHLLRQICEALHEAHRAGLIHRDLKPPNLFAAYRGGRYDVAKVLDFGLVKSIGDDAPPFLTQEGIVTGSPLYMAPELILRKQPPDGRVDVYSLGAVAYFLLTGRPPFLGADAVSVMMLQAHEPVEPTSRYAPNTPPDLERVVLRCLEKSPDARFQNVGELSRALAVCADADGWSADAAESWWRRHHPIQEVDDQRVVPSDSSEVLATLRAVDFPDVEEPDSSSGGRLTAVGDDDRSRRSS